MIMVHVFFWEGSSSCYYWQSPSLVLSSIYFDNRPLSHFDNRPLSLSRIYFDNRPLSSSPAFTLTFFIDNRPPSSSPVYWQSPSLVLIYFKKKKLLHLNLFLFFVFISIATAGQFFFTDSRIVLVSSKNVLMSNESTISFPRLL